MENLTTELGPVLALVPAFVIALTNNLKPLVNKSVVFLIPYVVAIVAMIGLFFVFNEQPIGVYVINGIIIAFGATMSYNSSKKKEEKIDNDIDFGLTQ